MTSAPVPCHRALGDGTGTVDKIGLLRQLTARGGSSRRVKE
jgi:hypothetical protein